MEMEYEMNNNIAFDLGAFNYPCMWDNAVWISNKENFKYIYFFEWGSPCYSGSDWMFYGRLDGKKFKTLEHKHYYIKGRLSSYSVGIEDESITVYYANSIRSRDIFVKFISELIVHNFGKDMNWHIDTTDGINTVPCTPGLILKADKEIIKWILNGEMNYMNDIKILFKRTNKNATIPTYAKHGDCCCDLYSVEDVTIIPGERKLIDTGIAIELPQGFEAQIRPRSGNAWKQGVTVLNTPGTIDEGFRNSLKVILINHSDNYFVIKKGDRVAQMKFSPVYKGHFIEVDKLSGSERGTDGCGSTGR
jgi:dUTP pyrophosphatase